MVGAVKHDQAPPLPPAQVCLRQKRRHTKSRSGCVTCKGRRVKCDESLPHCRVCSTRGLHCKYAPVSQLQVLETTPSLFKSPLNRSTPATATTTISPQISTSTSVPDALLWQYYLSHAGSTITASSTDPAHTRMWAESVPAIAFGSAVVAHALMAFSAFCLCASPSTSPSLSRKSELRAAAERHYYRSVSLLRESLADVDVGGGDADVVLACAMVLIPCGLALVRDGRGVLGYSRDWVWHLRGWRTVGARIYGGGGCDGSARGLIAYPQPGIPEGEDVLGVERGVGDVGGWTWTAEMPLMREIRGSWAGAMARLRRAVDCRFECRRCVVGDTNNNISDAAVYTSAITALEHVVAYILTHPVANLFRAVFVWPIKVPPAFIELLLRQDGMALAIYAHWLVVTMALEDLWWLKGFGSGQIEKLVEGVAGLREAGFDELLAWPIEMLDARRKDRGR